MLVGPHLTKKHRNLYFTVAFCKSLFLFNFLKSIFFLKLLFDLYKSFSIYHTPAFEPLHYFDLFLHLHHIWYKFHSNSFTFTTCLFNSTQSEGILPFERFIYIQNFFSAFPFGSFHIHVSFHHMFFRLSLQGHPS